MSTGIGNSSTSVSASQGAQKPDASRLVDRLFAKLDAAGQGSIDKASLESAFSKLYAAGGQPPGAAAGSTSADTVFKALDGNGDGKLTKQEATDSLNNILTQLDKAGGAQKSGHTGRHHHHMEGAGDAAGAGFTKDQLVAKASELSAANSPLSAFIGNIANNFSAVDGNGDGKINAGELRAFMQSRQSDLAAGLAAKVAPAGNAGASGAAADSGQPRRDFVHKAAQLMRAYGGSAGAAASTLSVLA
jgi:Ca2+-binding EF-hand superfamily protein